MKRKTSVALQYAPGAEAPIIVARGEGELAERLLEIARASDVPIVESEELAHSLVEIDPGELIPERLYAAVAEVLAYVWRAHRDQGQKVWDEEYQGQ